MSKRKHGESLTVPSNVSKVCVENVIPMVPAEVEGESPLSHPALISFTKSLAPKSAEDVKLRVMRRKTLSDGDPYIAKEEMIARGEGREWHGQRGFNEMNTEYFVGIRNKKTNKLLLVESDGMYCLRPFVPRDRQAALEDANAEEDDNEDRTFAEQKSDLLQAFGGQKSIQRAAKYQKNRITEDNVDEKVQVQVNSAAKAMLDKDAAQGIHHGQVGTTESMAPPHDNDAISAADAYPLEGLISPPEMMALRMEAESIIETAAADENAPLENPGWHPLVWDTLVKLLADKDLGSDIIIRRMQAAMHLHYLFVLSQYSKKIFPSHKSQIMEDMAVDETILECLLERFTVRFGSDREGKYRVRTAADINRAVAYGLIMWLTMLGFKNCATSEDLCKGLGVGINLVVKYAIQLGCKVHKAKDQNGPKAYRLSLKVPLTFPPIRKRQGRPEKRA